MEVARYLKNSGARMDGVLPTQCLILGCLPDIQLGGWFRRYKWRGSGLSDSRTKEKVRPNTLIE